MLPRQIETSCQYRVHRLTASTQASPTCLSIMTGLLHTLFLIALTVLLAGLSGCATTESNSSGLTGIEGPSNQESPEEAAAVQSFIKSARPQPFPDLLDGCWKGSVAKPDSITRLLRAPPDAILSLDCCARVDYALCFDRASETESFSASTLGFRLISQWFSPTVVPMDSQIDLLYSSGDNFAALRSVGHYEVHCGLMAAKVSSQTDLRVTYLASGKMDVEGAVKDLCSDSPMLNCEGQPWAESTWHAEFIKDLPGRANAGGPE